MLKLGAPSGDSMLMRGRTLSRQRKVPRMWQARILIEKNTGSLPASESPKAPPTERADGARLVRGARGGWRAGGGWGGGRGEDGGPRADAPPQQQGRPRR